MKIRNANPWWTRWQRLWRRWRGHQDNKTHQVHWVWVDGKRQKRVRFATPQRAREVADGLQAMATTGCFPALHSHSGCDVFVAYVPQTRPQDALASGVAAFYQALYRPQMTPAPQLKPAAVALAELNQGLSALEQAGWIDAECRDQIDAFAHRHAPPMLVTGYDYVDAVAKNFLFGQDRWFGIDIEAIEPAQWLGLGLAKAEYRGLVPPADPDHWGISDPLFKKQYPIVRLIFLVGYFNAKLAQGKPRRIRIEALTDAI